MSQKVKWLRLSIVAPHFPPYYPRTTQFQLTGNSVASYWSCLIRITSKLKDACKKFAKFTSMSPFFSKIKTFRTFSAAAIVPKINVRRKWLLKSWITLACLSPSLSPIRRFYLAFCWHIYNFDVFLLCLVTWTCNLNNIWIVKVLFHHVCVSFSNLYI